VLPATPARWAIHLQQPGAPLRTLVPKESGRLPTLVADLAAEATTVGAAVVGVLLTEVREAGRPEGDPRTSRIVFITRDLPRGVIEDGLRAFQAAAGA